jgi:hypothetical protein
LLARKDIQVNSAIKVGKEKDSTPLIIASYLGRVAIVQLFLNHPDIDLSLRYLNKTALEWAAPNAHSDVFDEDFKESHIDNAISDPIKGTKLNVKLNVMLVGSTVALAAAVYMIKEQLNTDNYESSGFVLFNAAGVQVDLKIWLPITIAIPLYLLGQFIAGSKSPLPKLKFMRVGSFLALLIAMFMVTIQLIAENYESSGFVLFTVEVKRFMSFSLQVDLKIWLPLFVATLLFLHGQFRECPEGDKLITLDYYTVFPFNVFSSDPKDSVEKDSMVLLNTCKANRIKVVEQFIKTKNSKLLAEVLKLEIRK